MAASGSQTIQLYYSTSSGTAPVAGNLVSGEIALNITDGKLYYKDNGGTVQLLASKAAASGSFSDITISGSETITSGTANGVAYLNGSKVLTTGSALTFDGTNLGVGATATDTNSYGRAVDVIGTNGAAYYARNVGNNTVGFFGAYYGAFNSVNIGSTTNSDIVFYRQNSEQMRLTSKAFMVGYTSDSGFSGQYNAAFYGSVGIGTSSPSYKLDVTGPGTAGGTTLRLNDSASSANSKHLLLQRGSSTATFGIAGGLANDPLWISRSGGYDILLDASGNLGLGVTPSAWNSSFNVFQLGGTASLYGRASTGYDQVGLYSNARFASGTNDWRYLVTTTGASGYLQSAGSHSWYIAGSGTAGAAITFTQAMTLDASGNLGIGITSPTRLLHLGGGAGVTVLQMSNNASGNTVNDGLQIIQYGVDSSIVNKEAGYLSFETSNTERARFDSSGNLLFGTASSFAGQSPTAQFYRAGGAVLWLQRGTDYGEVAYFKNYGGTTVGNISVNATTTSYNTSSDYRLKENIQPMTGALAKVAQLKPCTYNWKADGSAGEGFIAHELQAVVPQCVTGEKDAVDAEGKPVYQGIDTSFLVATLTAALQEAVAEINQLKARLDAANL